jgi:hypothetical protein
MVERIIMNMAVFEIITNKLYPVANPAKPEVGNKTINFRKGARPH